MLFFSRLTCLTFACSIICVKLITIITQAYVASIGVETCLGAVSIHHCTLVDIYYDVHILHTNQCQTLSVPLQVNMSAISIKPELHEHRYVPLVFVQISEQFPFLFRHSLVSKMSQCYNYGCLALHLPLQVLLSASRKYPELQEHL